MDTRQLALQSWLDQTLNQPYQWSAPIGDASARRYFRLTLADGSQRIVMDAPPEQIDCQPFLQVAERFRSSLRVPAVLAQDLAQGFLLLEDLGETDYQQALQDGDEAKAEPHYRAAITALVQLQTASQPGQLPDYDAATLAADLDRFPEWYIARHLGQALSEPQNEVWQKTRALLLARMVAQPKVFVHFDFHSRNLLLGRDGGAPGVIDFQDARYGPLCYDLASLLKDAYLVWPEAFRLDLCVRYWQAARAAGLPVAEGFDDFYREFEITGVYRQLRTLGTFARLSLRDGKTRYLDDMPTMLAYLRETCVRYSELHPLYKLLNQLTGAQVQTGYTF